MSLPLVDPARLTSDAEPIVVATHQRQPDVRVTPLHSHPRGQLLGTVKGAVSVRTPRSRWIVPPVNAVWLPPGVEHEFASHGAFDGWSVYVAKDACICLPPEPKVIRLSPLLHASVLRSTEWRDGAKSPGQLNIARVILDEIVAIPGEALDLPMPADRRLIAIANAILLQPGDRKRLAEWAKWAGISARSLSRKFVGETGLTFTAWRHRAVLLRSLEMLAEKTPVTTVAIGLGYDTVSAFIELFQSYFGTTPGRYSKG